MKRFIALFVVLLVLVTMLTACSKTYHSETVRESAGKVHLFWTNAHQEYLNFLENFDDAKYEIMDISKGDGNGWYVTYKEIEE